MSANLSADKILNKFLDAFEALEFERLSDLLSEDNFRYVGPMDKFDNAKSFIADLVKYGQILKRIDRHRMFVQGNEVCALLTFVSTLEEIENTRMSIWVTVENEKIIQVEGFFDVRAYARMIGQ